jgi:hypothetical protein
MGGGENLSQTAVIFFVKLRSLGLVAKYMFSHLIFNNRWKKKVNMLLTYHIAYLYSILRRRQTTGKTKAKLGGQY